MIATRKATVDRAAATLGRPMTARSVVLSLLLGRRPPRARVALLVRWCELFGISENATRVALSRMVERGELTVADAAYELAGRIRGRQAEQELALDPPVAAWSGNWHLVVVGIARRSASDRSRARDALRRAHFAEQREGLWLRPDNLPVPDADLLGDDARHWLGAPADEEPHRLVAELFELEAAATRGDLLASELHDAVLGLEQGQDRLADAFVVGAAALQHLRRDPLLPGALLPDEWPGAALRTAYLDYRDRFSAAVGDWWRQQGAVS